MADVKAPLVGHFFIPLYLFKMLVTTGGFGLSSVVSVMANYADNTWQMSKSHCLPCVNYIS